MWTLSRRDGSSTVPWYHVAMPDDHHPLMPRRNPEDIDLGCDQGRPFYLIVGGAAALATALSEAAKDLCRFVAMSRSQEFLHIRWNHRAQA